MRVYSETYGCTMNKGDTELMLGSLEKTGHKIVEDIDKAELVIVNTCAVKRTTLNKVIHRLNELHEETDKKIIVAGCLPLIDLEKIEKIGTFSGIISCQTTDSISKVIERIENGKNNVRELKGVSDKPRGHKHRNDPISAPVSIAEGCTSYCSYCCVKFARGRLRSFKPEKIIEDVKEELKAGRKQIYITTQDTAAYGLDIGTNLSELLEEITSIPQNFRVRVGMMNPKHALNMKSDLIRSYDDDKIYKFLHLPIQSGNNEILKKMKREYSVNDFKNIVESFRKKFPELYLATDIIVGFPGETKKAFQDSCKLIEEIKPDKVNLTRFTPMPGTEAKDMEQVISEEKKRRSKKMSSIIKKIGYEINKKYVGSTMKGLVVKKGKKGGYMVRLPNYKPAIVENVKPGEFVKVEITDAKPTYLVGEIRGHIQ